MTIVFVILGLLVAFCFIAIKAEKIYVYEGFIFIKDDLYPLKISNDTIVSISLVDNLPSLIYRTNGAGMGRVQKGYFTIRKENAEHSENATLYIRNKNIGAIEIKTVKGLVYINRKTEDLTQELFDEMKNTIKMVKENELNYSAKKPRSFRSVLVIIALLAVVFVPILFMNYSNEIVVNDDVIEIKGDYAMDIPFSDIDTVLLVEKLPAIKLRTNGISTRKVNIGNFKMSDGNKCRLYINKAVPLYIEIRCQKANGESQKFLIFINKTTVEETRSLYEEIFDSMYD